MPSHREVVKVGGKELGFVDGVRAAAGVCCYGDGLGAGAWCSSSILHYLRLRTEGGKWR